MKISSGSFGCHISFDAKPSTEIIAALKANGFRWSPRDKTWFKQKGAYADFCAWLERHVNGPAKFPCWDCKCPDGIQRQYGAATPVYCDRCHERARAANITGYGTNAQGFNYVTTWQNSPITYFEPAWHNPPRAATTILLPEEY